MTPTQALNVIAQMVVNSPATYADHMTAQQALRVLQDAISPKDQDGPVEGGSGE